RRARRARAQGGRALRPRAWLLLAALLLAPPALAAPPGPQGRADAAGAPQAAVAQGAPAAEPARLAVDGLACAREPAASDPAVAAVEEGARTLLVTPDDRLGGLFVLGELNVLDLKPQPHDYQLGLFDRWWRMVGRDEAFDVPRAEAAFERLLQAAGVRVVRSASRVAPVVEAPGAVTGVRFTAGDDRTFEVGSSQVIDASGDADLAAAAGAAFDLGWSGYGVQLRMADTLVLRVAGVDWRALVEGVRARGRAYAVAKDRVVWGHFGGAPAAYQPS